MLSKFPSVALAFVWLLACTGPEPGPRKTAPSGTKSPVTNATTSSQTTQAQLRADDHLEESDGLQEIDGRALRSMIRQSGRKATLLNVWASWCGSCKRELPMLVDLASALEAENVGVLFVSVDTMQARPAAVALLETLDPRPASMIASGPLGPFKRAVHPEWKGALPATVLYDAQGEVAWFWPGPVLEHEITSIVTALLAGEPLQGPTLVEPGPPAAR